jgi:lysophospholipase L1-like esterase
MRLPGTMETWVETSFEFRIDLMLKSAGASPKVAIPFPSLHRASMIRFTLPIVLALLTIPALRAQEKSPPAQAAAASTPAAPSTPAIKPPPQPPDVPAIKLAVDGTPNAGFLSAHERFVKTAREGKAQLLFLGDSITAGWGGNGKAIWTQAFGAWEPANFGIGGDRTQHLLWRIQNGELNGLQPKAAVVMIGTNNVGGDSAEGIAKGVTEIVETIREKTPGTKILLLAVFPRGQRPNPGREKLKQVNQIIAKLDDGKNVFFLDIGDKFLTPDGLMTEQITPDFLHLSAAGYQIWADAITPKLQELMK